MMRSSWVPAAVAAALLLGGCNFRLPWMPGPEKEGIIRLGDLGASPGPTVPPQALPTSAGDFAMFQRRIRGHVYVTPAPKAGYQLQAVTRVAVAGAKVRLRRFGLVGREVGAEATTDADGAFIIGTNDDATPAFLESEAVYEGRTYYPGAPVPQVGERDVTVDLDVVGTMVVQALLERANGRKASELGPVLQVKSLETIRQRLDLLVTDATVNAPVGGGGAGTSAPGGTALVQTPTALFEGFDKAQEADEPLRSAFAVVPAPPSPAPLLEPITREPAKPDAPIEMHDPPIFLGDGDPVTGAPKPASYLLADFTMLKKAGPLAVVRFTGVNDVLMACIDHEDHGVFAFFRDNGFPGRLKPAQTGIDVPVGVAAAASGHLFVLGANKLVRLAIALGPKIDLAESLAAGAFTDATAIALNPAGTKAYVGRASGAIVRVDLASKAVDAGYQANAGSGIVALAAADDGAVHAATAAKTIVSFAASGEKAPGTPPGIDKATSVSLDAKGDLYVGTSDKRVVRVRKAGTVEKFLDAPAGVTGVARLGGYLYLTEADGALDCLTVGE